jgi:hypothetical protein
VSHLEVVSDCERLLGALALDRGATDDARERLMNSLAICREAGNRRGEATASWWLAKVDSATGVDAEAVRHGLSAALRAFQNFGMIAELLDCLEDYACLTLASGDWTLAARLYAAAAAQRERLKLARPPRGEERWRNDVTQTSASLGRSEFEAAWAGGAAWSLQEAIHSAVARAENAA